LEKLERESEDSAAGAISPKAHKRDPYEGDSHKFLPSSSVFLLLKNSKVQAEGERERLMTGKVVPGYGSV